MVRHSHLPPGTRVRLLSCSRDLGLPASRGRVLGPDSQDGCDLVLLDEPLITQDRGEVARLYQVAVPSEALEPLAE